MNVRAFVKSAVEATLYVVPTAHGLSVDELCEVALRFGLKKGETRDAVEYQQRAGELASNAGRIVLTQLGAQSSFIGDFNLRPVDDLRNPDAFDEVHRFFVELAREHGIRHATADRAAVLQVVMSTGRFNAIEIEAAIECYLLVGRLVARDGRLGLGPGAEQYALPSQQVNKATPHRMDGYTLPVLRTEIERVIAGRSSPFKSPTELQLEVKQPPALGVPPMTSGTTQDRTVLFLDVKGWTGLSAVQIKNYVERAMPLLKTRFDSAKACNTWGDGIFAIFDDTVMAAKAALAVLEFFKWGSASTGVEQGITCRISLHKGTVIVCHNAFLGRDDYFGPAIHTAARLEPVTEPGHVFCTSVVTRALDEAKGIDGCPRAWPLGRRRLAKDAGEEDVAVVTPPNELRDPTIGLKDRSPYDELAHLRVVLGSQEVNGKNLLAWLMEAKLGTQDSVDDVMAKFGTAGLSGLDLDAAYWWLIVDGVFEFSGIDVWWNRETPDPTWKMSVRFARVAARGAALMRSLQS